jgi:hypothetical protein
MLLAAALVATSCSDKQPTQPTQFNSSDSSVIVQATPQSVIAQPVNNARCPSVAPFQVGFNIVVRANGTVNVVVTNIVMQFTDVFGVRMPQVTSAAPAASPGPLPSMQFGTALVQARSQQVFPIALGIGCVTTSRGTLVIMVQTRDDNGRTGSAQTAVAVQ